MREHRVKGAGRVRDDGASSDLRIGDWVPAPRSEPPAPVDPTHAAPAETVPWGGDPAPRSAPPLWSSPLAAALSETPPAETLPAIPTPDTEALPLVPTPRTEAIPPEPGWTEAQETVLLPAFLRGVTQTPTPTPPAPDVLVPATDGGLQLSPAATLPPAEPAAETPAEKRTRTGLPASERNMLIFVTALLAAGALAIVAMGHGALNKKRSPSPTQSATNAAFVGAPNVDGYCHGLAGKLTSRAPDTGHTAWSCAGTGHSPVTFTPTDVCRAQYGPAAHAEYTNLADTKTWRCLR